MANMEQRDSWVVQVEKSLEAETRTDESHDDLIHTVPKSLVRKNSEAFYLPQVISLGPYHFTKKETLDDKMELLKSELAREVHYKIIGGVRTPPASANRKTKEEKNEKSYVRSESGLKSVMESFKMKEKKIKVIYAIELEHTSEVCAWIIARDACFVLQVLERFRRDEDKDKDEDKDEDEDEDKDEDKDKDEDEDEDKEKSVLASIDRPLLIEIVKDMLKMENQLPFWALQEIRPDIGIWFESALKNLSPIEVADVGNRREYKKKSHILQLLHDYIVDRQQGDAPQQSRSTHRTQGDAPQQSRSTHRTQGDAPQQSHHPFSLWRCIIRLFCLLVFAIILLVLSPVLFIMLIIFVIKIHRSSKSKFRSKHVPTVEELKRVGVKFKKLDGEKRGVSHIKFKNSNSTLYLPQFEVDDRSEVILRNLIALEICSKEEEKPITRYAILMNDLINTSEDVAILRREEIITSRLGSDEAIAQLWNSMVPEVPRYDPIDTVVTSVNKYRKNRWKVLWAQFIVLYCSKPWLFLSLMAGIVLLLLTFVQVVCLFESCQIK